MPSAKKKSTKKAVKRTKKTTLPPKDVPQARAVQPPEGEQPASNEARPPKEVAADAGSLAAMAEAGQVKKRSSARANILILAVVALISVVVIMEVGVMMKNKVDRQRSLKEVTTIGERGGPKRLKAFQGTTAEKIDALNRLLLVDAEWDKVMVYDLNSDKLLFVIDSDTVGRKLFSPADVAADGKGRIFVLDPISQDVSVLSKEGKFLNRWPATNAVALCATLNGDVYVADNRNMEIRRFSADGKLLKTMGGAGTGKGKFMRPFRMALDSKGNLYVIDQGNKRLQVLGENGREKASWPLKFEPNNLTGITIDKNGVYVNDFADGFIWIYNEKGKMIGQVKIAYPSNLAIDHKGYFYLPGPGGITRYLLLKGKDAK